MARIAVGMACLALVIVGFLYAIRSVANGIGQGFSGLVQGGAAKASLADGIARANHIPDGALTPALLNTQTPYVTWLTGSDSVPPISDGHTYVSLSAAGDHVVAAVSLGACEYGLTVETHSDPITGLYRLPGVGTYFAFSATPASTNTCSADSAPTSGWVRADSSVLKVFNAPLSS